LRRLALTLHQVTGPHGLTLVDHARKGGPQAEAVVAYLESIGDADLKPESQPLGDEALQACVGRFALAATVDGPFVVEARRDDG
jgi:hypothetical protein